VAYPPPRSETERGRGTMRNTVEEAFGAAASGGSEALSTALRAVPLPRFAGQDEDAALGKGNMLTLPLSRAIETRNDQEQGKT
jgi:hypothetical protein